MFEGRGLNDLPLGFCLTNIMWSSTRLGNQQLSYNALLNYIKNILGVYAYVK